MYICSMKVWLSKVTRKFIINPSVPVSRSVSHVGLKRHNLKISPSMSKENLVAARPKVKKKEFICIPGTVSLQVLGTGARGAPRSLYIFTDKTRYMFNCGEGTQRLAQEHKMKLSKLDHIFVTHSSWYNIGGLPGMALTMQKVGVPEITLHGPPGLGEIFSATEKFVKLKEISIKMAQCVEGGYFEDSVFTITYVPVLTKILHEETENSELSEQFSQPTNTEQCVSAANQNHSPVTTSSGGIPASKTKNGNSSVVIQNVSESDSDDNIDYYEHERVQKRKMEKSKNIQRKRRRLDSDCSMNLVKNIAMAFICKLKDRPGTLCLERCVDHKVPPGPLLGRLKAGEDVTLEDGTVVRSQDVRGPDVPGPLFIVVDCPTDEYVPSLVENPAFRNHQASAESDQQVACLVVHFTPPSVMSHPRYFSWMDAFSPSTQHLVLNESSRCMGSIAVHRAQYLLNSLARGSGIFPSLNGDGIKMAVKNQEKSSSLPANPSSGLQGASLRRLDDDDLDSQARQSEFYERLEDLQEGEPDILIWSRDKESVTSDQPSSRTESPIKTKRPFIAATCGQTLLKYHLRPFKGFDRKDEVRLHPDEYDQELRLSADSFEDTFKQLHAHFTQRTLDTQDRRLHPKVTFLGTGSSIPNKTRNTSGILLGISEESYMILDCGEGTYGQLIRLKGWHQANVILQNLQAIYVSHLHADHHIGFIALLQARRKALAACSSALDANRKLLLLAPVQIHSWLQLYHNRLEPILQDIELVSNATLDMSGHTLDPDREAELLSRINLVDINTCRVIHCPYSYGVSLHHKDWKITYSGDTMPCAALEALGKNSTLLIHEATMEDDLEEEAKLKMHSTTSQALEAGRKMNAQNVLLTHFSQRYAKLPRVEGFSQLDNVGIAFDNMEVGLDDLKDLPVMIPALKVIFAEHYDELETKAHRRHLRKQVVEAAQIKV